MLVLHSPENLGGVDVGLRIHNSMVRRAQEYYIGTRVDFGRRLRDTAGSGAGTRHDVGLLSHYHVVIRIWARLNQLLIASWEGADVTRARPEDLSIARL
jgi:hypothetical protein